MGVLTLFSSAGYYEAGDEPDMGKKGERRGERRDINTPMSYATFFEGDGGKLMEVATLTKGPFGPFWSGPNLLQGAAGRLSFLLPNVTASPNTAGPLLNRLYKEVLRKLLHPEAWETQLAGVGHGTAPAEEDAKLYSDCAATPITDLGHQEIGIKC